jgi:hypothetical protein
MLQQKVMDPDLEPDLDVLESRIRIRTTVVRMRSAFCAHFYEIFSASISN